MCSANNNNNNNNNDSNINYTNIGSIAGTGTGRQVSRAHIGALRPPN